RELEDRIAVIARGIRSVGWDKVVVALVDPISLDAASTVSAGYTADEEAEFVRANFQGSACRSRFEDSPLHPLRLGSSYFLPADNAWVQANVPNTPEPPAGSDLAR